MNKTVIESVMGLLVLVGGLMVLTIAYRTADLGPTEAGYPLKALFFKVGGLQEGNEVRIGGVEVGTVTKVWLDQETYDAVVEMSVSSKIKLPVDTVPAIAAEGIFGGTFILLEPGESKEVMKPGDTFAMVRDASSLEDLIGEAIF